MTLTYVFHSGFMLEGTDAILIFDFWRDAANGVVEQTLRTTRKRAYFLASHFHPDHFNPEILRMEVPCGEKRVILSRDIYRRRRAGTEGVTAYLRRGETFHDDFITLRAFPHPALRASSPCKAGQFFHPAAKQPAAWDLQSHAIEYQDL